MKYVVYVANENKKYSDSIHECESVFITENYNNLKFNYSLVYITAFPITEVREHITQVPLPINLIPSENIINNKIKWLTNERDEPIALTKMFMYNNILYNLLIPENLVIDPTKSFVMINHSEYKEVEVQYENPLFPEDSRGYADKFVFDGTPNNFILRFKTVSELLEDQKPIKVQEINAEFDKAVNSGVLIDGFFLDCREKDIYNWGASVNVLNMLDEMKTPQSEIEICDFYNKTHKISTILFREIYLKLALYHASIYNKKWELRNRIDAAKTFIELENISW